MAWLGVSLPILNWLSFGLIEHFHIPARAMTGQWYVLFLAVSYCLGAWVRLEYLFRGLAVGLSISSMIAVGQALGLVGIASFNLPAGLFYNSAIEAAAMSLVIIALVCVGDWRYIPAMLPGLMLAQSRGAWLILLVGIVGRVMGWRLIVFLLVLVAAFVVVTMNVSDTERFLIWNAAWQELTWMGHGAGSFANMLFVAGDGLHYPGHVHNDYLQIAFEFGVWGMPIYLIYAAALSRTEQQYWPVFAGFAACSAFFFPLYAPVTGFIGAMIAGHIIGHDSVFVRQPLLKAG